MEWIYKNKPVIPPEKAVGFVYCITNKKTGQKYIGKKFLLSHRTKKVAGRKNRKHIIKESDWRKYYGSNEFLIEDVKKFGEDNFIREILNFYNTKKEVTYAETEEQFKQDVLRAKLPNGKPKFLNRNILGKFFPSK
jgi:Putative endonuclease segE, GIY-YIG domain